MNLRDPQAQAQAQTLEAQTQAQLQPPQPQTEDNEEALLDSASSTTSPRSTSSNEPSLNTQLQTPETPASLSLQEQQRQRQPSSVPSSHLNLPVRAKSRDRLPSRHTESGQQAASAAAEAQAAAATARAVQAQHQHIQLQNLLYLGSPMNGINGTGAAMQAPGVNAGAAMAVGPTPAGHQAELNVIYTLVEELSRQLAENRRQTEEIVSGIGRVRNRARERALGNDEVLGEAADEIYGQEDNIETLISALTESLDRAKNSRDANFALVTAYARVLSNLLNQFHAYKAKHTADVSAWHRSYRSQLAEARAENSRLREQIWEMQDHAGRANKMLREFRKKYDENEARMDRRVEEKAKKQEIRFWKRLAMPEVDDNDENAWSDDDDIVDPVEKERLKEVERKTAEQALAGLGSGDSQHSEDSEGEDSDPDHPGMGIIGGVAMERDGSLPAPPPRPASTGSTGGQAG
ncbi:hypothetical protein PFICI_02195 [Pestalotiopsis fici W106-1]|uniref:Uncharacterized protein n=1 Tax=Pestalotiopsis fici (strain W106-1 / CGMCC3.15140) TaxID=1229662 RepID=W3XDP4_PESFW|nr:uncharacterized protein PFICI_02195 [Pestalotiopsis fici W106-1]ETS84170.1 hypothetical protein PFICI_02195 [Pestalotiopsis fici W106-1]